MSKFRPLILLAVATISAVIAYGLWSRPSVEKADSDNFSAERVVRDIEVISKKHHSVAHPAERAEVRDYLVSRLENLGADTVELFEYKNLVGPQNKHVVYTFDATNILAHFSSPQSESNPALLLVAHYDSRYSQPMPHRDTVWSYGAADDGYGVGVILETVRELLERRSEWKQSVKVLFTDAEEVGMMGMKAMWENNREQFDDVGFMINIEARGPWGPALLFETSPGNERVMELYSAAAEYPFTYSLTTVVYSFMPNFTDFTIVKDYIPGMNFSTIADINHYHTDLDNFSNIEPKSIQHYGSQVVPVAMEYVTNAKYSDIDALRATEDTTNFTVPALGLINLSAQNYMWLNIAIFALFIILFAVEILRGRVDAKAVIITSVKILISALIALIAGEIIALICGACADVQFKPFGIMQGIKYDNAMMIISVVIMVLIVTAIYIINRKRAARAASGLIRASAHNAAVAKYSANYLYGALLLLFVLSAILLFALGENLMFLIPLTAATATMILLRTTHLKVWIIAGVALVLLHAFSFLYALSMALTIGALGAILMLALCDFAVLLPLSDIYLTTTKKHSSSHLSV